MDARSPRAGPPSERRDAGARWIGRRSATGERDLARPPQPVPPSAWMLPDAEHADEDGVVGVGADLDPSTLVDAYRRGIFPWPHPGVPLPWFSPDPRGVIALDGLHVPRRLRSRLRTCGWTTTVDVAFDEVIAACADRPEQVGTWITTELRRAYVRLHRLGWAHSIEVWSAGELVGGLYGVQVGGVFTGESMFHRVDDASKVALIDTVDRSPRPVVGSSTCNSSPRTSSGWARSSSPGRSSSRCSTRPVPGRSGSPLRSAPSRRLRSCHRAGPPHRTGSAGAAPGILAARRAHCDGARRSERSTSRPATPLATPSPGDDAAVRCQSPRSEPP